jgi:ElaB/YqjD/DUF883 family membrane-anchored ribosome-binding protein
MNTKMSSESVATQSAPLSEVLHDGAVEIKQTLGHMTHDSKDAIGQMVKDGKSHVDHLIDTGQARVGDWKSEIGKAVVERPIQSLLIAAGVGSVLGMLLRWRSA